MFIQLQVDKECNRIPWGPAGWWGVWDVAGFAFDKPKGPSCLRLLVLSALLRFKWLPPQRDHSTVPFKMCVTKKTSENGYPFQQKHQHFCFECSASRQMSI